MEEGDCKGGREEERAWGSPGELNLPNFAMSIYKYTTMHPIFIYNHNALIEIIMTMMTKWRSIKSSKWIWGREKGREREFTEELN